MKVFLPLLLALVLPLSAQTDLEKLRTGWKEARERALEPVDRKYLTALEALKARLTREGKLEEAVAAGEEAEAVANGLSDPAMDSKRVVSRWAWGSGGTLTLMGDGVAKHTEWGKAGGWSRLKNGDIVLESDVGHGFLISFGADGSAKVRSIDGGAVTTLAAK